MLILCIFDLNLLFDVIMELLVESNVIYVNHTLSV